MSETFETVESLAFDSPDMVVKWEEDMVARGLHREKCKMRERERQREMGSLG